MECTGPPCPSADGDDYDDEDDNDDDNNDNDDDDDDDSDDEDDGDDVDTGSLVSSSTLTRPRGRRKGKRTDINPTAPTLDKRIFQ